MESNIQIPKLIIAQCKDDNLSEEAIGKVFQAYIDKLFNDDFSDANTAFEGWYSDLEEDELFEITGE